MLGVLPEVVNAFSELFDCPLNNISCLSDSFGTFSGGLCCVLGILMLDSPLLLGFAAGRYFLCAAGLTSMLPELSCRMSACLKCSFGYFLAALSGLDRNIVVLATRPISSAAWISLGVLWPRISSEWRKVGG